MTIKQSIQVVLLMAASFGAGLIWGRNWWALTALVVGMIFMGFIGGARLKSAEQRCARRLKTCREQVNNYWRERQRRLRRELSVKQTLTEEVEYDADA